MRRLIILFTLSAIVLSACGGFQPAPPGDPNQPTAIPGVTPSPGSGEQATISFAIWDYERSIYEPLAERFSAENPGINVVLVSIDDVMMFQPGDQGPTNPTDSLRRIVTAADTAPAWALTPEAYGTPLLLDLRPLMEADASFDRDDFYPGALERYEVKGGAWALPRFHYVQVLNYNRELFENAGIPEPRAGWTWDELLATAERLTERTGLTVVTHGYMEPSSGLLPLLALLDAQGIDPFASATLETDITGPVYVEAIERVRQYYRDGVLVEPYSRGPVVSTGGSQDEFTDPSQLVRDGRVAIWGELYLSEPDGSNWQPAFPVGQVPYPISDQLNSIFSFGSEGFIISGGTQYPNEAWRWVEWLSRQPIDQQQGGMSAPGRIPARESLAEQLGFWDSLEPQTAEAYRWSLANSGAALERQPDYLLIGALSQAMSMAISDPKADVRNTLDEAQRQMRDAIAQAELTPTPRPDLSPVIVATPEPQTAPVGALTISFGVYGYSPTEVRRVVRAFREARPDIFVELKNFEPSPGMMTITAADLAQNYDCFSWAGPLVDADYAALLDLRPLLEADAAFPRNDLLPASLTYYERDGRLYGLPLAVSLRNLVYSRAAFDAAGLPTPLASWTPDEFLAAAQALTKGDGAERQWGYVPLGGAQSDLIFFINQLGGSLTTGAGAELRPNYTDPKTVAAIRWFIELSTVHQVMPPLKLSYRIDDPGGGDQSYELIQSGRAAMWLDYGITYMGEMPVESIGPAPTAPAQPTNNAAAPLPVGGAGVGASDMFVRGLLISAGTQQQQACWEWLKYLSADVSLMYGDMPARRSVAESPTFLDLQPPERVPVLEAMAETLKYAGETSVDNNVMYAQNMDPYWLFKAISEAAEKGADLDQGLVEAQRLATAFAECMAEDGAVAATCAKQVDPTYRGFNTDDQIGIPLPAGRAP